MGSQLQRERVPPPPPNHSPDKCGPLSEHGPVPVPYLCAAVTLNSRSVGDRALSPGRPARAGLCTWGSRALCTQHSCITGGRGWMEVKKEIWEVHVASGGVCEGGEGCRVSSETLY